MKLTKELETEILDIYHAYWDAYLKGDMHHFANMLDENLSVFGTAISEVFNNKQEAVTFYNATAEQMVGKADFRNRQYTVQLLGDAILIREQNDLFALLENEWVFYGHVRITAIFGQKKGEWKLVHQHASFPDNKAGEGEQIAAEKIKAENLELREAVKRRTVELEYKNRELAIEASLERVRSRSMAMHSSEELGKVVTVLLKNLHDLGFITENGAAAHLIIFSPGTKDFVQWSADPFLDAPVRSRIPFTETPLLSDLFEAKEKGLNFFTKVYSFEQKNEFFKYAFEHSDLKHLPAELKELILRSESYTHWMAIEENSAISVNSITGNLLLENQMDILKRFARVFEQAYIRFLDLKKAETQAREAQIELSLERVRARTMAMHASDELVDTSVVLFQELRTLGVKAIRTGVAIIDDEKELMELWSSQLIEQKQNKVLGIVPMHAHPFFEGLLHAWRQHDTDFIYEFKGEKVKEFYEGMSSIITYPAQENYNPREVFSPFFFPEGSLTVVSHDTLSVEERNIMQRFARVFGLLYRRFLDLQKAEAQAREAQIEAALERVRSRTMGMRQSHELGDVATVLFKELNHMVENLWTCGFVLCEKDRGEDEWWLSTGDGFIPAFYLPNTGDRAHANIYDAWKNGETYHTEQLEGEALQQHYDWLMNIPVSKNIFDDMKATGNSLPAWQKLHCAYFSYGYLVMITQVPCPEESIFKRFAQVFDQTYTRFLDLKKAEGQAREAEIELGLERVRAKAMAMRNSDELKGLIGTLFTELTKLDLALTRCVIWVFEPATNAARWWMANGEEPSNPMSFYIMYHEHPAYLSFVNAWKDQSLRYVYDLDGQNKIAWDDILFNKTELANLPDVVKNGMRAPERVLLSASFNSFGGINTASLNPLSEEHFDILLRFAKVFDLTYTRFLDLQKAEAQAKEARIEAALEKVRSRSLAMHRSEELQEIVSAVFDRLKDLGIETDAINLDVFNDDKKDAYLWTAVPGHTYSQAFHIPYNDTVIFRDIYEGMVAGKDLHSKVYTREEKDAFLTFIFEHTDFRHIPEERKAMLLATEASTVSVAYAKHIAIIAQRYREQPFSESENEILKRFAKVFEQAYVRFLDLQRAESQALEAIKRASVDRVRAEIASMRTTSDLERITPLIWNELTILGVPFIRCGVFIMDEEKQEVQTLLSTPDGEAIAAFRQPYNAPGEISAIVDSWHKKEIYKQHWNEAQFLEFTKNLVQQGAVTTGKKYLTENPPKELYLHFLPFLQGMLYAGNTSPFSENELQLVQNLADTFSTAYARYEDFNKLEAAKKQVDNTLNELQVTQKQLIQSEKMASLGELTAGIAHEIQNPLNFVTNFSEVSAELLEEMKGQLVIGNSQEAKEIANNVIQNLEKILNHGRRADGIVKGMLQHSRTSSGQKEPTNINVLADEYLRLAYHGLRAKENSFTATLKTEYDETIGNISIIPQDIGRVILNLIMNAFYAVDEKRKVKMSGGQPFEPTVTVSTKKSGDKILVTVKDNGNGVPQKVLDKIFQPFFTTKPTGQGTGLGLSISYDIVNAHGGELKVASMENEGTTFIIELPGSPDPNIYRADKS